MTEDLSKVTAWVNAIMTPSNGVALKCWYPGCGWREKVDSLAAARVESDLHEATHKEVVS